MLSECERLIKERGLRLIGGNSKGVELCAIKGLDYVGDQYKAERDTLHPIAYQTARELASEGKTGVQLVWGSEDNPQFRWPIWARIPA